MFVEDIAFMCYELAHVLFLLLKLGMVSIALSSALFFLVAFRREKITWSIIASKSSLFVTLSLIGRPHTHVARKD